MAKLRPTRQQSRAVSQWGGAGQFRMGFVGLSLLLVQREGEKVRERRGLGREGESLGRRLPESCVSVHYQLMGALGAPGYIWEAFVCIWFEFCGLDLDV